MNRVDLLARHTLSGKYAQPDMTYCGQCKCGKGLHAENAQGIDRAWAEHVDIVLDDEA